MRVAIVHDWLNGMRGGEKVLEALLEMFPQAAIHTLFHQRGRVSAAIESHPIVTSPLQRIPGIFSFYRNLLPLFPRAIESFDFSGFDLVISSSHAVAKGIWPGRATHICYCHTPMRYIWDAEEDYRMAPLTRAVFRAVRPGLRKWDVASARRVHHFMANSGFVAARLRKYYGRESDVVPPPIDTDFFNPSHASVREDFYLAAGALVPYKRFDVAIRAFNASGKPLVVAGDGPELKKLRSIAASNVNVRGWVSNEELRRFYRTAKALIYPAREDFGMVAAEARGCGCPVIAFGEGGVAEIVEDGRSGLFFAEQTEQSLNDGVQRFERKTWPAETVAEGIERFSRGAFQTKIWQVLETRTPEITRRILQEHAAPLADRMERPL